MKYILKNYLFGAETPVKHIGFELLTPEIQTPKFDEEGNNLGPEITLATYSDVKVYDTDIALPNIPEGDEAYFVNVNLWITEENNLIPPFEKLIPIVSFNSMTGFEVDAQRSLVIAEFMSSINN